MGSQSQYKYVIVGGGLAGASAIDGIREIDKDGSILLVGAEKHPPYHRPPLSKQLWFGKKQIKDISIRESGQYGNLGVELSLGTYVVHIDVQAHTLLDGAGRTIRYEKLLLATGGHARRLEIPGGDLPALCYFRTIDDYLALQPQVQAGTPILVIGGGFIGSEMAAALASHQAEVTMLFSGDYLCKQVFPEKLGRAIMTDYEHRGIRLVAGDTPRSIEQIHGLLRTHTVKGAQIDAKLIVVGVGLRTCMGLAHNAGMQVEDGIVVNEQLHTSAPSIFAAGDNTDFLHPGLDHRIRIEHWDNALHQGKQAGRNMAGANEPYTYMPYFFSDLFDFGYEAVGEVSSKLETVECWEKEFNTGVVYYLKAGQVRGVMLCNIWDKISEARALIQRGTHVIPADLQHAIHA